MPLKWYWWHINIKEENSNYKISDEENIEPCGWTIIWDTNILEPSSNTEHPNSKQNVLLEHLSYLRNKQKYLRDFVWYMFLHILYIKLYHIWYKQIQKLCDIFSFWFFKAFYKIMSFPAGLLYTIKYTLITLVVNRECFKYFWNIYVFDYILLNFIHCRMVIHPCIL